MTGSAHEFSREYDLPREIVWDAITDPDLVFGWLAEASISPRTGGHFDLRWCGAKDLAQTHGEIVEFEPPLFLAVSTTNIGDVSFELSEAPGGTRGAATRLTVRIVAATDKRFAASVAAHWLTNFDQLEDLLRGHPVDWANWERDRRPSWNGYFEAALQNAAN